MENSKVVQVGFEDYDESLKGGEVKGNKQQKMEHMKYMGINGNGGINKVVVEKWKGLVIGLIKTEKLKSLLIAQSRLTRLKLWALGATALLLVCACLVQLSTLSQDMRPRVLMFRSSQDNNIHPPPQISECVYIYIYNSIFICLIKYICSTHFILVLATTAYSYSSSSPNEINMYNNVQENMQTMDT